MKRIILALLSLVIFALSASANIVPAKISDIPQGTIGVYQPTTTLNIYSKADKSSKVLYNKTWSYLNVEASNYADNLFSVLLPKKELSFVYTVDIDEDFVQVIYNKQTKESGWVYKEDNFQFLPWITFYNMYGRKYGLKVLKEVPDSVMELHTKSDKNSQSIAKLNRPREIRLTAIQGNWALITALDIEGVAKTGYIQWRGENGELYLFPNIK